MTNPEVYNRVVQVGIDILNDFAPNGALPVAEGDQVVEPFNKAAEWVRNKNGLVVQVKEDHPEVTNHFIDYGGLWPAHGVRSTWGAEFIDGLDVQDGDPILKKGTDADVDAYSGYMGVGHDGGTLETYVYPTWHERVAVVIGGLATDYCVKATVLDALEQAEKVKTDNHGRELGVYVLKDAMRAVNVNPGDGDKAIAEMEAAGARLITADQLANGEVIEIRN